VAACEFHARTARAHNNANILCLGERITGQGLAASVAEIFLATPFEEGRHARRVALLDC
jgi:ribose 5-phosphate isomerase B